MKKYLIFILMINCFAFDLNYINKAMQDKDWAKVCKNEVYDRARAKQDDGLMNAYGKACLELDYISKLNPVITALVKTPEARMNAMFYTTILYKKKLLYAALIDGVDISTIKLPKCDYILSDIYDDYVNKKFEKIDDKYIFNYNGLKCEVSVKKTSHYDKVIFKIIDNEGKVIKTKEYW